MNKNIVLIGGGHGTAALAFYLKECRELNITAVVAVSDMGGSSQVIRDHYEEIAVGDIRIVIESLIPESFRQLRAMMGKRIQSQNSVGFLDGHPVGNIELLMAIKHFAEHKESEEESHIVQGIKAVMLKYRAWHSVLPVTADNVQLQVWFNDGTIMEREGVIDNRLKDHPKDKREIVAVYLRPMATILPEAQKAILNAHTIVVCAGSPFTSIGACFSVQGVAEAIRQNEKAKFVQVMNLMTNANESPNWQASQHAENVYQTVLRPFDCVICNDEKLISPEVKKAYRKEKAKPVRVDRKKLTQFAKEVVVGGFADESKSPIRHNARLAKLVSVL